MNRAVVACNSASQGCVLSFVGKALDHLIFSNGVNTLNALGLDGSPDGISIWEGEVVTTKMWTDYGWEYDCHLEGEFREPTDEEWAAIRRDECPWPSEVETEEFEPPEPVIFDQKQIAYQVARDGLLATKGAIDDSWEPLWDQLAALKTATPENAASIAKAALDLEYQLTGDTAHVGPLADLLGVPVDLREG